MGSEMCIRDSLVEGIDTESFKVKLKVNMFGRETPAEVDIAQVELP